MEEVLQQLGSFEFVLFISPIISPKRGKPHKITTLNEKLAYFHVVGCKTRQHMRSHQNSSETLALWHIILIWVHNIGDNKKHQTQL
jgi:hypothetical protein